jgi:hypothetical protein
LLDAALTEINKALTTANGKLLLAEVKKITEAKDIVAINDYVGLASVKAKTADNHPSLKFDDKDITGEGAKAGELTTALDTETTPKSAATLSGSSSLSFSFTPPPAANGSTIVNIGTLTGIPSSDNKNIGLAQSTSSEFKKDVTFGVAKDAVPAKLASDAGLVAGYISVYSKGSGNKKLIANAITGDDAAAAKYESSGSGESNVAVALWISDGDASDPVVAKFYFSFVQEDKITRNATGSNAYIDSDIEVYANVTTGTGDTAKTEEALKYVIKGTDAYTLGTAILAALTDSVGVPSVNW